MSQYTVYVYNPFAEEDQPTLRKEIRLFGLNLVGMEVYQLVQQGDDVVITDDENHLSCYVTYDDLKDCPSPFQAFKIIKNLPWEKEA